MEIGGGKMDWFAHYDGDGTKTQSSTPARPGFASAENSYGHDGRERFCDHEPQSGQRGAQVAVKRPLTLRKNQGPLSRFQDPNQRFQSTAIVPFLIDGNHIQFGQKPTKERPLQKCFPRQKKDRAIGDAANKRRVEITFVVRRHNHGTLIDHAFAMDDAKPETNPANQLDQIAAEPVVRIQNTWRINDLVNQ